jgi:lipopolysaccharide exporter
MRRRLNVYRRYARGRLRGATHFFRPVSTLLTGAAAAQALVFATRPVLTRLFTPDEFGVLTVFVTLVAVLATFASGRYEDALMLPRNDSEAVNVLALALLSTTLTALLVSVALVGMPLWEALLGGAAFRPALWLLPAAVALAGWSVTMETWHTRHNRFRVVSVGRAVQSAFVVTLQLAAGVAAVGAAGLVGGAAAGFAAAAVVLGFLLARVDGTLIRQHVRLDALRVLARRYARFPLFSAPAALLNVLAGRAPVLLLAAFFTAEAVGQFGVAFGTLAVPLGLVAGAVGQVFFVRAAEAHREGTLGILTLQFYQRLLFISTYPALAVLVAGPTLFAFVFGPEWETAGIYARALSVWVLFFTVAVPLTRVFDVTEHQRADFTFSIGLFAVQTGGFVAASLMGSAYQAVLVLGVLGAGMRLLHLAWILKLAGASLRHAIRDLLRVTMYVLPPLVLIAAVQHLMGSGLAVLTAVLAGGLLYVGLAAWRGDIGEMLR